MKHWNYTSVRRVGTGDRGSKMLKTIKGYQRTEEAAQFVAAVEFRAEGARLFAYGQDIKSTAATPKSPSR